MLRISDVPHEIYQISVKDSQIPFDIIKDHCINSLKKQRKNKKNQNFRSRMGLKLYITGLTSS